MKNFLLIFSFAIFLLSCQPIMKKFYGIKNPEIENEKTILIKVKKYKLDSQNIVIVKSKEFPYVLNGQSIPDGAIYDSEGKYIEYRQTDTSCNAGLFQFIPELKTSNIYNKPDKPNLSEELAKFTNTKGDSIEPLEKADFYLLIYWTVWTGRLNKDHVKIWEDLAKANKNCKIKVIKVNLDLQETWGKEELSKITNALKKKK